MKKKLLSLAVISAMCMSMAQGVYASTGYNTTTTTTTTDVVVNTPVVTTPGVIEFSEDRTVEAVVTADLVANTAAAAVAAAVASPTTEVAVVTLKNVDVITVDALATIAQTAIASGTTASVAVEKVVDGQVVASVSIDPVVAAALGSEIKLNVETDSVATRGVFETFFSNEIAIASFDQSKSFGMEIEATIKLDLSKIDITKELQFFSYDPNTNTFVAFTPAYTINPDGTITFLTSLASDIIITDTALTLK